jgi:hypothetical protein
VESFIGTAIFVDHRVSVAQSQDCCDGGVIFTGYSNRQSLTHRFYQVAEPRARLGKQAMASPGRDQQPVKVVEKVLGATRLIRNSGALGSLDPPLDRVLVEAIKDLL